MAREDYRAFADWLRDRMRDRRLGQNQLAEYLGIGRGAVSEYLRAIRRPRLETLRKLAEYFDVPLADVEALLPDLYAPSQQAGVPAGTSANTALRAVAVVTDERIRLDLYDLATIASTGLSPESARQLHEALLDVKERFGISD